MGGELLGQLEADAGRGAGDDGERAGSRGVHPHGVPGARGERNAVLGPMARGMTPGPRRSVAGMHAIRQHEFGPPDVLRLEEVPDPEPGPGQVRIAVAAAGVHLLDTSIRPARPVGRSRCPTCR